MHLESPTDARRWIATKWGDEAAYNLEVLERLLADENKRQNLVSTASLDGVWLRHFADSAQLSMLAPSRQGMWLDIGTGAGFPGIVIALLDPAREVRLVESRKRRCEWLRFLTSHFCLDRCKVIHSSVESLPAFEAMVISARAFAPLDRTLALGARFSTPETVWLLPKGRSAKHDKARLPNGVSDMFHVEQSATDPEAGIIVGKGRIVT